MSWEEAKQDLERESESSASIVGNTPSRKFHEDHLWADWREEQTMPTYCLFCNYTTSKVNLAFILIVNIDIMWNYPETMCNSKEKRKEG